MRARALLFGLCVLALGCDSNPEAPTAPPNVIQSATDSPPPRSKTSKAPAVETAPTKPLVE